MFACVIVNGLIKILSCAAEYLTITDVLTPTPPERFEFIVKILISSKESTGGDVDFYLMCPDHNARRVLKITKKTQ